MANENSSSDQKQTNLTFADMTINVPPVTNQPRQTAFGKCQRFQDLTVLEKVFLCFMLCSIVAAACFTIARMTTLLRTEPDFTFCIFLLVNAVFCICFTIDAILRERPSELIILILTTIIILIYLIINYAAGTQNDLKLARLIIASITCPILTVMGFFIAKKYIESKHLIVRTVGAFEKQQQLYRNLLFFQDVLKFDLQLGISIVILVLDGDSVETHEKVILGVGICVQFAYFFLGWFTFEREIKKLAIVFWIIGILEFAYIIWKMYDVSTYITHFAGLAGATIACIIAALVIRSTLLIGSYFVYRGFDQGLKAILISGSNTAYARNTEVTS